MHMHAIAFFLLGHTLNKLTRFLYVYSLKYRYTIYKT